MVPDDVYAISGREIGGWIAPDGTFFRAYCGDHEDVAERIVEFFLGVKHVYYYHTYLVERGWIRLETSGDIWHSYTVTGQQFDVLYYCYAQAYAAYYKEAVYKHVAPTVQAAVREPMPQVPSQGDQENLRRSRGVYA